MIVFYLAYYGALKEDFNKYRRIMKLVDAFMYFDEDLMLDLRLNILNDIVDTFVIADCKGSCK